MAASFRAPPEEYADLVQDAMVGVCRAAAKFDPARDVKFSVYARYWGFAEMSQRSAERGSGGTMGQGHNVLKRRGLGVSVQLSSLDTPAHDGGETWLDVIASGGISPEEGAERAEMIGRLRKAFVKLTPRARTVLRERFRAGRTLAEVGADLGISRERVRQIEAAALKTLREKLEKRARP